jgi:hypothetical protein
VLVFRSTASGEAFYAGSNPSEAAFQSQNAIARELSKHNSNESKRSSAILFFSALPVFI